MSTCLRCHAPCSVLFEETGLCNSCIDAEDRRDQEMRRGFSPPPKDEGRCQAITKNTEQCLNKATFGVYCACHIRYPPTYSIGN